MGIMPPAREGVNPNRTLNTVQQSVEHCYYYYYYYCIYAQQCSLSPYVDNFK